MLTKSEGLRKNFVFILIIFIIIFFRFIFSQWGIYNISSQFVENYLAIYTNAHDLLLEKQIPMWSWNFFLGGNFLGEQKDYSIYNPFFLITMFFSSGSLPRLYFPLLFLKTCLAAGSLYLYMKETGWFSRQITTIASLLFIFNGWYLTNLDEFVTLDLLVFVPFVLYGAEKMIGSGKKRWFVGSLTLLLVSNFPFLLVFLPMLLMYILIRLYIQNYFNPLDFCQNIKNLFLSLLITGSISMIFILPVIIVSQGIEIQFENRLTYSSLLTSARQLFILPFYESDGVSSLHHFSIYQSVLVFLLIPQFLKLVNKPVRFVTMLSYPLLVLMIFILQSMQVIEVTSLITIMINVLSIVLILFHVVLVGYVVKDISKIDLRLLNKTSFGYKVLLFLLLGGIFSYESYVSHDISLLFSRENMLTQFISFSPYLIIFLIMCLIIDIYQFVMKQTIKSNSNLNSQRVLWILVVECILTAYLYFETSDQTTNVMIDYVQNEDNLGNATYAVEDYLKTIDSDFYRIINSYETPYNDPIYRGYNGFSTTKESPFVNEKLNWMLDQSVEDRVAISSNDYMLTTALSAKYYFTLDYEIYLPGYEYYDRIEGITIYKNNYFIPIGSAMNTYILDTEFEKLDSEQKKYIFLTCMILTPQQVDQLKDKYQLKHYNLNDLPNYLGEIQYYEAAQNRSRQGVKNVTHSQNVISHRYSASRPTILSYSIPYDKGWIAYSDEVQLNIHEVNSGFIGVEIPTSGHYNITLEYRAPGFDLGLSISSLTGLIILIFFVKYYEDRKKCPN